MTRFIYYSISILFAILIVLPHSIYSDNYQEKDVSSYIKRRFTVQNYILVWLDQNINIFHHHDNISIRQLREIFSTIYTFDQASPCIELFQQIKDEQIFFIVSDKQLQSTVSKIHHIPQLYSIYVLTRNDSINVQWTNEWNKIRGIFHEISHFIGTLTQDTEQCNRNSVIFGVTNGKTLDRLNSMFLYTCLLKQILLENKGNQNLKKELVTFSRNLYQNSTYELQKIDTFDHNYRLDTAIWWYTQRCFLYQMLNRALRTYEIEVLMKMGFFLRDIQQQIEESRSNKGNSNNLILIYRGQGISTNDLERLKRTRKGDLLVFNNFLTASLNKKLGLQYARDSLHNPEMIGVLYNITVNISASSTPFVSRRQIDALTNEKEGIWFSTNSIFRIADLKPLEKRLWEIELILVPDDDSQLSKLHERLRKETSKSTRLQRLGDLLIRMKQYNKAEDVYQLLLHSIVNMDSETLPYIYNQLGRIKNKKQEYTDALAFHRKALDIQQKYFSSNHLDFVYTYNHFGTVYNNMQEYEKSLDFYGKTLIIQQDLLPLNHPNFITTYKNFGSVYQNMQDYSKALEFYLKVLHIQEQILPSDHGDFINTYQSIASIHDTILDYTNALLFYEKELKIYQKSFPSNYPYFVTLYQNIGKVHKNLKQYPKALKYFQKALKIQELSVSPEIPNLTTLYHHIALTFYEMKNYSKALEYFNKTLGIQQKYLPLNHLDLAVTNDYIGLLYQHLNQQSTAVTFFERAVEIAQLSVSQNDTSLALYQNHLQKLKDEL